MTAATATKGTILVTGANGGLGSAIAEQIVSKPEFSAYYGLYTVRNTNDASDLNLALTHGSTHPHDAVALDLTKLDNVRQVAKGINSRVFAGEIPPIRALILNAGFHGYGKQSWTDDRLDTTFAANYLGHWLLTLLLLQSMDKEAGRIVLVGSQAHDPDDPRNAPAKAFHDPKYKTFISDAASFEAIAKGVWSPASEDASFRSGIRRYGAAKLFLIMMQHELQARLDTDRALSRICVLGVDPSLMISGFQRLAPWVIRVLIFGIVFSLVLRLMRNGPVRATSRCAGDVLEGAFGLGEGGELPKGRCFDGSTPLETSQESRDVEKRQLVWKETVKLTGLKEGETVLGNWK
ncbi:MAG: hypothetical protein M1822_007158 [Bathelium mastoideum]|nr:MAG: hypothetical protein M1822_007158 [Bathelium mastoideum]